MPKGNCKTCKKKITTIRKYKFCSTKCRIKSYNQNKKWKEYRRLWNLENRGKYANNKIQCLICQRWYVQVGSHVYQTHKAFAREYREHFDLEVKRGTVPDWYRKLKGDQTIKNKTYLNLKAGKKFRFKPNDPRAGKYKRSPITLARLSQLGKRPRK